MDPTDEFMDELQAISLTVLGLTSFVSSIDVISDFFQGYLLYRDPELRQYGIVTIGINWIPGVIASIHLLSNQGRQLGLVKTLVWCLFLTTCYPVVPTLTFLSVLWVRGIKPNPQASGETENATGDERRAPKHASLIHWARMAPIIEGGIEAPLQFLLQTWLIMTGKLPGPFDVKYVLLKDFQGNGVEFPKLTAITLLISGLAILKTCVDLNIVRIHLQEGCKFVKLARRAIVFLPYFMISTIFRLYSISLLMAYAKMWILLPAVSIAFLLNLIYGSKR